MASPTGSAPPPAGGGPSGSSSISAPTTKATPVTLPDNWVAKATDKIVTTVDGVRAKTTVPIEKVGRVVIWGLLIATAGAGLAIVLIIGLLRMVYELVGNIPGIDDRPGRSVWMIDVLLGVLLITGGLIFIRKGTKPPHED
jgi:hypothetical protein